MSVREYVFGKTGDGRDVAAFEITNKAGASMTVISYGAILQSLVVPDAKGAMRDVVLGYDTVAPYETNPNYFGATIGRNGNRIAGAAFTLNGRRYQLAVNENDNNLHSCPDGYNFRLWEGRAGEDGLSASFTLHSPDLDQGFPGAFDVTVTYALSEDNALSITYDGVSNADTVANMTNHSYFNLNGAGCGDIYGHCLTICADGYTPVDSQSIPLGTVAPVEGTPFDFRTAKPIGRDADLSCEQLAFTGGYDHNFALRGEGMRKAAEVFSAESGILMEVRTDLPGIQFYAGNFLSGPAGKGGAPVVVHGGLALETQYYPNAVNEPSFASPVLKSGERYLTTTVYAFGVKAE